MLAKDAWVRQAYGSGSGLVWSHHQSVSGYRMKDLSIDRREHTSREVTGELASRMPFLLVQCPHIH